MVLAAVCCLVMGCLIVLLCLLVWCGFTFVWLLIALVFAVMVFTIVLTCLLNCWIVCCDCFGKVAMLVVGYLGFKVVLH